MRIQGQIVAGNIHLLRSEGRILPIADTGREHDIVAIRTHPVIARIIRAFRSIIIIIKTACIRCMVHSEEVPQLMQRGRKPSALAKTIAAALKFDYAEDKEAVEIQNYIRTEGMEKAITHFTDIPADSKLFEMIMEYI